MAKSVGQQSITASVKRQDDGVDVDVNGVVGDTVLQFTVEPDGRVHFWGFVLDGQMVQGWGDSLPSLPESEFTAYLRNVAGYDR